MRTFLSIKRKILFGLCIVALGRTISAQNNDGISLFPELLMNSVPEELVNFSENYIGRLMHMDSSEQQKRMEFDEVELSFPINAEGFQKLKEANQLSLDLVYGRIYKISWIKDNEELGYFSFPASYNLIKSTDQEQSFIDLKHRIIEAGNHTDSVALPCISVNKFNTQNVVTKDGEEFYLGHLNSDTYIDLLSHKPVWGMELPEQSLANLFILGPEIFNPMVEFEMEGYDREKFSMAIPFGNMYDVLTEGHNIPYFGIAEKNDAGDIEAMAVFYNPLYAYIHSLTIEFPASQQASDNPKIKVRMLPYIKLHNVKNLWSEKY